MPKAGRPQLVENWNELKTKLVWAYHGPIQERFRRSVYRSYAIPAWLIRRGRLTLRFKSGVEHYKPGFWVFPRLAEGRQEFSADAEILSVRFEAIWPDGRPLFDRSRSIVVPEEEGRKLTRIGERLARIVERSASENLALEQTPHTLENFLEGERVFYGWLVAYCALMKERGQLPHVNRQLDERVWLAVSRLEARRLSEPVREQEIARVAGLSVTQLNRLFVSNLGKTPAEYWEDKRIRSARSALLISGRSIKSIAYDLGFSSLPHFSAWVKKRMGVSPRDFRKKGWSGLADNRG